MLTFLTTTLCIGKTVYSMCTVYSGHVSSFSSSLYCYYLMHINYEARVGKLLAQFILEIRVGVCMGLIVKATFCLDLNSAKGVF